MPWAWWRLFAYYQKTSRESYHSSTWSRSALHVFSQWTNPFSVFTSCSCQMLAAWNGSHKHTDFTLLPLELSLGLSIRDVFLTVPSKFFFLFHFSNLLNRSLTSSCWFLPGPRLTLLDMFSFCHTSTLTSFDSRTVNWTAFWCSLIPSQLQLFLDCVVETPSCIQFHLLSLIPFPWSLNGKSPTQINPLSYFLQTWHHVNKQGWRKIGMCRGWHLVSSMLHSSKDTFFSDYSLYWSG